MNKSLVPFHLLVNPLLGLSLVVSEYALVSNWVFPKDRFVAYDKSDEWWARKYGFGYEGPQKPGALKVGNVFYIHPEIEKHLKESINEAKKFLGGVQR